MGRRAESTGSTTFASFLPNACTDRFFLPNVFADDEDEIYERPIQPVPRAPQLNWWHANAEPRSQGEAAQSRCPSTPTPSSAPRAPPSAVSTARSTAASSSGRRRRTRRPGGAESHAAASCVSAVTSVAQTVVISNYPSQALAAERREGAAGGRARPQGRSMSTPRMRNPDGATDDEAPSEAPRRRAEDDVELAKLREHARLKATLRQFQDAFAAEHGRRPQFVRDWKPVWEKYQRYQALRGQVSASTISAEMNGIV